MLEAVFEFFFDIKIVVGAAIGFVVAVPVVLNNPQWFSSRQGAIVAAGKKALEEVQESEQFEKFLKFAKDKGILKE